MQPNLIQHPRKVRHATDALFGTFWVGHAGIKRLFSIDRNHDKRVGSSKIQAPNSKEIPSSKQDSRYT
jgi:hypothetical protein